MTQINKKLKIVLDTNVLLVTIPSHTKYHWIFQKLINKEFDLFITNDILKEVAFPKINVINITEFQKILASVSV